MEVLYLLPEEFVREYIELFYKALKEDISGVNQGGEKNPIARAGDIGKKRRKTTRGKSPDGSGEMRDLPVPGSDRGAASGGKRYRNHWIVRNEIAFEVKRRVDRRLLRIVGVCTREVGNAMRGEGTGKVNRDASGRFGK